MPTYYVENVFCNQAFIITASHTHEACQRLNWNPTDCVFWGTTPHLS